MRELIFYVGNNLLCDPWFDVGWRSMMCDAILYPNSPTTLLIQCVAVTDCQSTSGNTHMNDLPRSVKLLAPSTRPRLSSAQASRKASIYFLAALIVSTMVVWFGFLGWGFIAMSQTLMSIVRNSWMHL